MISAVDRRHYTVASEDGCTNPPDTCPVETEADERVAAEIGAAGIEVLPTEDRVRIATMWETADAVARANGFNLDRERGRPEGCPATWPVTRSTAVTWLLAHVRRWCRGHPPCGEGAKIERSTG
ncbi:MAG: hypothetical protein IT180_15370, partial [Acidobacteria bacterium]|nr:hypothetical protein [Acidobacteriota bacterium]